MAYYCYYMLAVLTFGSAVSCAPAPQEFLPRILHQYGDGLENAQIFQIDIGHDVHKLRMKYAANVTRGCSPRNVTLYLRHGGLPIVNIKNAIYPNNTWVDEEFHYEMNFPSDNEYYELVVEPKQWSTLFGVSLILDDSNRIQQQGLTLSCLTLFWGRAEFVTGELSYSAASKELTFEDPSLEPLMRKNYPQPLSVKWQRSNSNLSASASMLIDVRSNPDVFTWTIMSPIDLGGTLQVEVQLTQKDDNSSVFACLMHGITDCQSGFTFSANNSLTDRKSKIQVPYPMAGSWYLSLQRNCSGYDSSECQKNTSVEVQISLSPCQEGICGTNGRCVQYFSSGLIYSACVCSNGYAGWACTDGSNATTPSLMLASVLLLTLSNLFFIPSIVLSFRRRYYPQCLMYVSTMFFSTFYHACDQVQFSFCMLPYSILQFGDFYSALTAVWWTSLIVAQPGINYSLHSTLSLAGTVAIAVAVHYDPTSLASFLIPIVAGFAVVAISWTHRGFKDRKCYPGRKYCLTAVLPCLVFSLVGLLCFAFLETEDNYFYVHSIWHASIALTLVFVLPGQQKQAKRVSSDSVIKQDVCSA